MLKRIKAKIKEIIEETLQEFVESCGKKSVHDFTWDFKFDMLKLPEEVKRLNYEKVSFDSLVPCDKCKCVLFKSDAIVGESTIEIKKVYFSHFSMQSIDQEVIKRHYFCHRCKKEND
jgi:hypothetical protein